MLSTPSPTAQPPEALLAAGQRLLAQLAENPDDASSFASLAQIALKSGATGDAITLLGKAIQLAGPVPAYCLSLAEAFSQLGDDPRAIACLQEALAQADDPEVRRHLANLLYLENRHAEAAAEFEVLVQRDAADAEAWFSLGVLHTMASRLDLACEAYEIAVSHKPSHSQAWNNLALLQHARRQLPAAELSYRRSLMANPDYRDALYNFALLLQQQERILEATVLYEKLLGLHPNFGEAHNNLGNCYLKLNLVARAKSHYAETLSLQASHREAPWNLGFASLLTGDFHTGWMGYEYRLAQRDIEAQNWKVPRWTGEMRPGERILVHHEQGLGDTIQFARYLHHLVRAGMKVDVFAQAPLVPLLARIPGLQTCTADFSSLSPGDWQVPFPSLPYAFRTTLESIPSEIPYLSVEPQSVREWAQLLQGLPPGFKVGIVWQGNPNHKNDHNRSLPPALLSELSSIPHVHLCSLQKGVPRESIPAGLTDLGRWFRHFGDTAAAIVNLDLVISVDTSVAHLAGALGKPVWVLLPFAPDWRWLLDRADSPWYSSARLFRQPLPGDWTSVLRQVRSALEKYPEN
jgi:tetratricopeptide (TPR) repeat protein